MKGKEQAEFRTVRGYQLQNQQTGQLTPAMEDYLEMAYRLCLQHQYTRVGKLSEHLHVKPSSASKMLGKLAELGYLAYDRYEIIQLTDKGREMGAYLLDRHNTVEAFLNLLGNPESLEETELIEHYLGEVTVGRLKILLDFFQRDQQAQARFQAFQAFQKQG